MYANINGINSKIESLEKAIQIAQPHIITLCETKTESPPIIDNYTWQTKTKRTRRGGGIAIATRTDITAEPLQEELEPTDTEIAWITIKKGEQKIHVGIFYGKQENNNINDTENEYNTLTSHINQLKTTGEVILTGDFNAKLKITKNNEIIQNESRNGKLLNNLIKNTNTQTPTIHAQTGLWTRVNRQNTNEKSVIDYILTTPNVTENIQNIIIDEEGYLRLKGKSESDHNTIICKLNNTKILKEPNKVTKWKINDKTNWHNFNKHIKETTELDKPKNYQQLEKIITQSLKTTIGQVTYQPNKYRNNDTPNIKETRKRVKSLKHLLKQQYLANENQMTRNETYRKLKEAQNELHNKIEKHEKETTQKIATRIIKEGGAESNLFWKIRKKILGKAREEHDTITEEGHTLKDPNTTKEYIANFYENLYQARPATDNNIGWTNTITESNNTYKAEPKQAEPPLTSKELKQAIKLMKNKKASGPDNIPNEVFKHADIHTLTLVRSIYNNILTHQEDIPEQWKNGNIIRFYKGKGKKGKCTNERGITLSSNAGKLMERIINNRITKNINITEAQAGGQKHRSINDHIAILKNIIANNKHNKKPTYITFLDVTKAYDKAWLNGILYVLKNNGINSDIWNLILNMSTNITANIITKHGPTRAIQIKDSIRQGGVLSVAQYALLMDEINKEIQQHDIGCKQISEGKKIGCLLWMDDVALIANNPDDMHKLLEITYTIAQKYHIEFGKDKSKIMTIGKKPTNTEIYKLGDLTIDPTDNYKYLGQTMDRNNRNQTHISNIKGKVESAYQTILSIMGNKNFRNIQMTTVWKLIKTCIIPTITHSCETMELTNKDIEDLNRILDNIIKRTLVTPTSTPREVLYIEVGLLDIENTINKQKLLMYNRIYRQHNTITSEIIDTNSQWLKGIEKIANEYNINLDELKTTKNKAKKIINKAITEKFRKNLVEIAMTKSKAKHLLLGKRKIGETYINKLTRTEASIIFKTRCRMIDIKDNYRNKYDTQTCRLCNEHPETQIHVLTECQNNPTKINYQDIFNTSPTLLKTTAKNITQTLNKLI